MMPAICPACGGEMILKNGDNKCHCGASFSLKMKLPQKRDNTPIRVMFIIGGVMFAVLCLVAVVSMLGG